MRAIGPIAVEVIGQGNVADLVREEFSPHSVGGGEPDVVFEIQSTKRPAEVPTSASTQVKGSRAAFRFTAKSSDEALVLRLGLKGSSRALYRVEIFDDLLGRAPVKVLIESPRFRGWSVLINPLVRWLGRDRATIAEIMAKNIIYEIIDPIIWMRLLTRGATFAHASAVACERNGVMFSGSGGVGKSTSLLSLMGSRTDVSYIGDDLVVVSQQGRLWRHPKKLQIYEYNLRGSPEAREAIFRILGRAEARLWRLRSAVLGPSRVRKRISAEQLFGQDRLADDVELQAAAWLTPARADPGWKSIDKGPFVKRATAAIVDEFWDFLRLVNLGSEIDSRAPSLVDLAQRSSSILQNALGDATSYAVEFPIGTNATEFLESFIAGRICNDDRPLPEDATS